MCAIVTCVQHLSCRSVSPRRSHCELLLQYIQCCFGGGAFQARFGIQALSPIRKSCYASRAQIANIFSGKLSVNIYSGVGIRYPVYTHPPADPNIIPEFISADPKIICAQ